MAEPQRKRCLYEVLGVSRDCSQEEIRSAYRRLALQLHPDKVAAAAGGAVSPAATAAFQELLHAYEVLSDPKERAYYDSHRTQILLSDPSAASKSHKSSFFDVDLYSYFSNSAFSGYSDSGRGFYKVYGDLFAKLYSQELWFADQLGLGPDAVAPAPLIGNLDSPYSQVTAFYNYWLAFCTVMDFCWVDEYDASMGPNRRSRRAMEEENKKVRKKARREYNDSVRGLAAFVKKRDKRVIDMQIKKNLEEEKRRAEEKAKKKEEERKRMEQAMMYEEPEWARVDNEAEETVDESGDEKKKKRGKGGEEFYCVVCNKKFKSDKQWKNHEQSKKHREKVAELRMAFKEEEEISADGEKEEVHVAFDYEPPEAEDSDVVDELCAEMRDDFGLQEEAFEAEPLEGSDQKSDSDDKASMLEAMVSGRKNRKSSYSDHNNSSSNKDCHPDSDDQASMGYGTRRINHRNRAARRGPDAEADAGDVREDPSDTRHDESEVQKHDANDIKEGPSCSTKEVGFDRKSNGDRATGKNHKHKKQQVNGKGDGKKETIVDSKNPSKGRKQKGTSKTPSNACGTCGESFESRYSGWGSISFTRPFLHSSVLIALFFISLAS